MSNRRGWAAPAAVLVIGLIATIAVALVLARAERGRERARFERLADGAVATIESRMLAQLTLLRGAAGFFNASNQVTREDFRAYVAQLQLEREYPGVLGIGYAAYAPDRQALEGIVAGADSVTVPRFSVSPPGDRREYSAILFLEPLSRRNRQALGFDMMSEPTRRAAMEAARQRGSAVMSGAVRLVQEIDPVKQPGFLIYHPLYRPGANRSDKPDPLRLYGWVYSPLRAHDLFGAIFQQHNVRSIVVEVFDRSIRAESLLFSSAERPARPRHATVRTVSIAERPWLIRVTSVAASGAHSPAVIATIVGVAGTLISLLIAFLVLQQARIAGRTRQEVELRTAELRESNRQLLAEAQARQEAEAKVAQMQKIEAIGQLTGGIAHDFNNMLTVIIGNLDIAQRRMDQPQRLRSAVGHARKAAEKAAELTQRLLAFGRQQALLPSALDANDLVRGMSELLRRSLGEAIRLEIVQAGGLWYVFADHAQLENAILNLAINARDAMSEGGVLRIETSNVDLDKPHVREHGDLSPGQYVEIALSDTGQGMTAEVMEKAVEPFFTTKEVGRGTGLGLSQVFGFVKQSGGHFSIQSELGEGTTVKIYLPRFRGSAPTLEAERSAPEEMPAGTADEVILVVEDEERVREISVATLRELGYTVLSASDGDHALEILAGRTDVRLLFTDVVMPGMNGRRLADAARLTRPSLKVIFTTGYTRNAIVHDGRLDEDVALLQKPFTAAALAEKVRQELDA